MKQYFIIWGVAVAIFVGSACYLFSKPSGRIDHIVVAQQEAPAAPAPEPEPAIPCALPKYKIGDHVKTVLPTDIEHPDLHWEGLISRVNKFVDDKNNQCWYTVIHYSEGASTEAQYYEFELKYK